MTQKTFTCAQCGIIGQCSPEDETEAELKREFGDVDKADCVQVCDDCWEKVKPSNNKQFYEKWRKDGEPCSHPGCASHISHPCEVCSRIGAKGDFNG